MTSAVYKNNIGTLRWFNEQGYLHRENGPAIEEVDGRKEWWLDGQRHRENGPAIEYANGDSEWYQNGLRHRDDGPAVDKTENNNLSIFFRKKEWWVNGLLHRENGPAVEHGGKYKEWRINDLLHCENGPAIVWPNGRQDWFINGLRHREDGPAIEYPDGRMRYYLHDKTGPDIEQQVKENMTRIQAEKEKQELLSNLSQNDHVSAKINQSHPRRSKKL